MKREEIDYAETVNEIDEVLKYLKWFKNIINYLIGEYFGKYIKSNWYLSNCFYNSYICFWYNKV